MTRKLTSIPRGVGAPTRVGSRPAVASAATDAESATQDPSKRQELRALKIMFDRGHMTPEEYERRRRAILAS